MNRGEELGRHAFGVEPRRKSASDGAELGQQLAGRFVVGVLFPRCAGRPEPSRPDAQEARPEVRDQPWSDGGRPVAEALESGGCERDNDHRCDLRRHGQCDAWKPVSEAGQQRERDQVGKQDGGRRVGEAEDEARDQGLGCDRPEAWRGEDERDVGRHCGDRGDCDHALDHRGVPGDQRQREDGGQAEDPAGEGHLVLLRQFSAPPLPKTPIMLMTAGPMTAMKRHGRMKSTSGIMIFTGTFCACSSARWRRLTRISWD